MSDVLFRVLYEKDMENRLTGVWQLCILWLVTFACDALGRRIEKVDQVAGTTTRYYYDDQRVAVQTLVSGGVETDDRYFVFGNTIDEVLVMHDGTGDLYYGHDHLYSPVALFTNNGTVVERYEYDVYGKVHILAPNYELRTASLYGNPYTFTGRELDTLDAGSHTLMYYRARTYDPETGRFMQRDPIGYMEGMNLYLYVMNNPNLWSDPSGLIRRKVTDYDPEKAKQHTTSWSYESSSFWEPDKCCCHVILEFTNRDVILKQSVLPLGYEPDGLLTRIQEAIDSPIGSIATKLLKIGLGKQ
jgi:RHS repeat-associated protein